jgi:hypothetical protein
LLSAASRAASSRCKLAVSWAAVALLIGPLGALGGGGIELTNPPRGAPGDAPLLTSSLTSLLTMLLLLARLLLSASAAAAGVR